VSAYTTNEDYRLPSLDAFRYIAVMAVVLKHVTATWMGADRVLPSPAFVNGLTEWAVPALFILSGYLFGRHSNRSPVEQVRRRVSRFLPLPVLVSRLPGLGRIKHGR